MSTEYHLFLNSPDFVLYALPCFDGVEGVVVHPDTQLSIAGLHHVVWYEMDQGHREVMRDDFGEFGLDVNWCLTGTLLRDADNCELMGRLYRCAAALVKAYPNRELSLMNTIGNTIYVHNTRERLLVSPAYLDEIDTPASAFGKRVVVDKMMF